MKKAADIFGNQSAGSVSFALFPLSAVLQPSWGSQARCSASAHNLFTSAEPDRRVTSAAAAADIVSLAPYVNAAATVLPLVSHGL